MHGCCIQRSARAARWPCYLRLSPPGERCTHGVGTVGACSREPEQNGSPSDTVLARCARLTCGFPWKGTMYAPGPLDAAACVLENQNKTVPLVIPTLAPWLLPGNVCGPRTCERRRTLGWRRRGVRKSSGGRLRRFARGWRLYQDKPPPLRVRAHRAGPIPSASDRGPGRLGEPAPGTAGAIHDPGGRRQR
jgi:hypothetical protein